MKPKMRRGLSIRLSQPASECGELNAEAEWESGNSAASSYKERAVTVWGRDTAGCARMPAGPT